MWCRSAYRSASSCSTWEYIGVVVVAVVVVVVDFSLSHLSVEGQVQPIANENLGNARSMFFHLLNPTIHPLKAPLVCDVVHQ